MKRLMALSSLALALAFASAVLGTAVRQAERPAQADEPEPLALMDPERWAAIPSGTI